MTHEEFVGQVQNRGHMASRADAERSIRATFETLAERLAGGEASHLAAQLPRELAEHLRRADDDRFERMDLEEFYSRVADREGSEWPDAVHHAKAVVQVLREAVTEGEFEDVEQQLPEVFDSLLKS